MSAGLEFDHELVRRLPLPLAQVYRRASNAEAPFQQHLAAFSIWELALKLLASTAVVEYVEHGLPEPKIDEKLKNLTQPHLGQWRELTRLLIPLLAERGDVPFKKIRDFLSDKTRDDLPRAAGLQAAISKMLKGQEGARSTVRLSQLFDDLVQYRNKVALGHGAPSQLRSSQHEQMAAALLAGLTEILRGLDVLAERRLLYVGSVHQAAGSWLVDRFELMGEMATRLEAWRVPRDSVSQLPDAKCVYLEIPGSTPGVRKLQSLHPLVLYEAESAEVFIFNGRKGRPAKRSEYLCYTTGLTSVRTDSGTEPRRLLAEALNISIDETSTAAGSSDVSPSVDEASEPGPALVRQIGEFQLLSELGEGGMGVVYRAWQPSLRRQVALKVISRSGAKAEARFAREIQALGKVDHPHVVKAYTSGSEGESWYYAMELVEGVPLSVVCERLQAQTTSVTQVNLETWNSTLSTACSDARGREKQFGDSPAASVASAVKPAREPSGPSPPSLGPGCNYARRVVELMVQVAEASHALHEVGVVHRDIKPGNIMVKADGKQAVLVDLGVAQLADAADGKLTRTRELVGTLRYASPQQVLAVADLDRRTDVYSLGVTFWELLTLRPFLNAGDDMPIPTLLEKIQREEPAPVRTYHPGIPRDLEAIVQKCVEKDPERRYQTAAAVAADLRRFLNGEPVLARPNRWRAARRRFAHRTAGVRRLLPYAALAAVAAYAVWAAYRQPKTDHSKDGRAATEGITVLDSEPPAGKKGAPGPIEEFTKEEFTQFEVLTTSRFPEEKWQFLQELKPMTRANRTVIFAAMRKAIDDARQENGGAAAGPQMSQRGEYFALLVGCTKFDNLPKVRPSEGPANDVRLMSDVLTRYCRFPAKNVVTLSDEAGGANRPTRSAIEREFMALSQRLKKGDQVAILLSGHGSQAPDQAGRLHSIFLPSDIGVVDEKTGRIPNAIEEGDLRQWLHAMIAKGAGVFLVVDASHSGTIAAMDAKGLVTLYAGRSDEPELERPMPYGHPNGKRHGLLTYTLCDILAKAAQSGSPLTYRKLAQRLQSQYVAWGRLSGPTPYVAGSPFDLDREVLGTALHQGRSRIVLTRNPDGDFVINVGRLNGLTAGSVLAVYPLGGRPNADKPIGYVRVTDCRIVDSLVSPVPYADLPEPSELPRLARCVLAELNFGDFRVSVLVDKTGANGAPLSATQQARLARLESDLSERAKQKTSLFRVTNVTADARWIIQYRGPQLFLLPADAGQVPEKQAFPSGTPLFPIPGEQSDANVAERLERIARAQNLIAIATESRAASPAFAANGAGPSEDDSDTPRLRLELLKCKNKEDKSGEPVRLTGTEPILRPGDYIAFRVTNDGRVAEELTLLFIDSEYAITPLWPRGGDDNRLVPNQAFRTPAYRINAETTGREQVVAIAIRSEAGRPPVDFTFLAQGNATEAERSLKSARGLDGMRSYDSALGKLLRKAAFADGTTRTFADSDARDYDLRVLSWIVEKTSN